MYLCAATKSPVGSDLLRLHVRGPLLGPMALPRRRGSIRACYTLGLLVGQPLNTLSDFWHLFPGMNLVGSEFLLGSVEPDGDLLDLYDTWCMYCLLYTSPSPRDGLLSRMPSSA